MYNTICILHKLMFNRVAVHDLRRIEEEFNRELRLGQFLSASLRRSSPLVRYKTSI